MEADVLAQLHRMVGAIEGKADGMAGSIARLEQQLAVQDTRQRKLEAKINRYGGGLAVLIILVQFSQPIVVRLLAVATAGATP